MHRDPEKLEPWEKKATPGYLRRAEKRFEVELRLQDFFLFHESIDDARRRLVLRRKQVRIAEHLVEQLLDARLQLRVRLKILENIKMVESLRRVKV